MLKAQVLRRNFSLFNRVPNSQIARSAARDGHETVTMQRFRIRTPFFSKSRLVGAIAISGALYGVTRYFGIKVSIVEAEATKKTSARSGGQISEQDERGAVTDEEEDDDDDEALVFLPTGFSRPRSIQYYKGSDPEWQEFMKVATDKPRVKRIREDLIVMVRSISSKSPTLVLQFGQVDITKGNAWLEVVFPNAAPSEYERPGIELTEDLQWRKATRPVEHKHHHRLKKILYPKAAATALYQDTMRKVEVTWNNIKSYIGWEEKSGFQTAKVLVQSTGADSLPNPPVPAGSTVSKPSSTSPAKDTQETAASSSAAFVEGLAKDLAFVLPDSKSLKLDLRNFNQDLRNKLQKFNQPELPRGSFFVKGLVEVYGAKARIVMSVSAAYDPQRGKFVHLSVNPSIVIPHKQAPRG